jgi:hypothetical protein
MDSTVKSLTITGTAAEDATRFRQKGSRRKRSVIKEDEESDTFIEQAKKIVTVKPQQQTQQPQQVQPVIHVKSHMQAQAHAQPHQQQTPQQVQPQQSSVILKPLKQPRVKLQPKTTPAVLSSGIDATRKARRIHLSVGNLNHRFTRAKRLKDDTEKKPMSSIREYLVGKGVIQQKSKAPEKMLRSMYSDFMLLKDQAL